MSKRQIMYHKEYAPTGREHELERVSLNALVQEGWVDHPAKIGVNLWGEAAQDQVNRTRDAFENGEIGPLDEIVAHPQTSAEEALMRENTLLHQGNRERDQEIDALKRELRESKEKLADHRSDAAKIEERKPTGPAIPGADLPAGGDGTGAVGTTGAEEPADDPDPGDAAVKDDPNAGTADPEDETTL